MQGWHHLNRNNNLEVCLENLHFEDYLILILWPIKMNFLPLHLIRFLSLYPLKETKYEILTILKITAMLLCLSNGSCENKTEFLSSKGSQGCCDPSITKVWLCHWKSGRLLPKHLTPPHVIFMVLFILFPSSQMTLASSCWCLAIVFSKTYSAQRLTPLSLPWST